jgi:hypothetical protein
MWLKKQVLETPGPVVATTACAPKNSKAGFSQKWRRSGKNQPIPRCRVSGAEMKKQQYLLGITCGDAMRYRRW